MMEQIAVKPIDTRKWNKPQSRLDLVFERDKNRKKSQQKVDERIHYMWFNYLQLCLDLERINYSVPKRGGRGKIISTTKVKVSKDIYRKWDLEELKKSSFSEWYKGKEHRLLFYEGGFRHTRGSQYHPLVKRFNVFILYHNMMNDKNFYIKGGETKGVIVCGKIVEEIEKLGGQKERYELLDRKDYDAVEKVKGGTKKKNVRKLSNQKRVMKDVVDCENTILAVCEGRFPK